MLSKLLTDEYFFRFLSPSIKIYEEEIKILSLSRVS